jgi:hypothetical protein
MAEFLNNFDKNLLKASVNKEDLLEAMKEWRCFREEECSEKKTCICNSKIKNVLYFLNTQNGNIICCGTVCCNKFEQRAIDNKPLYKILNLINPYNEYRQFLTIQEYLDYAKDELNAFMAKEIESSSKFEQLILLLDNINNINKSYGLDIFNAHIETIKQKLIDVIPTYINSELTRDIESIFKIRNKLNIFFNDYQIKKEYKDKVNVYENCIKDIVKYNIENYSGDTTPKFQKKIDSIIKNINVYKANPENTGKSIFLEKIFIEMNEKLKVKIQSIRDHNFAIDKARYEAQQKRKQRMEDINSKKKYF